MIVIFAVFLIISGVVWQLFIKQKELLTDKITKLENDILQSEQKRYRTNVTIESQLYEDFGIYFDQNQFMYKKKPEIIE